MTSDQQQHTTATTTAEQLLEIPTLYQLLSGLKLPGSTPPDPNARRHGNRPDRPPANLAVLDLLDHRLKDFDDDTPDPTDTTSSNPKDPDRAGHRRLGVFPTLSLWVLLVRGELIDLGQNPDRCCPNTDGHTVAGEAEWLAHHVGQVLDLHPEFAQDITDLHRLLTVATGQYEPPYVPRCPWCHDRIEGQGQTGTDWFKCLGCGRTWVMDAEIRRLGSTQDMTLKEIAGLRGISVKTLHHWSARGWITPIGRTRRGFVYDVARVDALVASDKVRQR